MRAVLDTNVIMSAVFFGGVPLDVLSAWHGKKCSRKVYGKESLNEAEWVYPTNSPHRFSKVAPSDFKLMDTLDHLCKVMV